jgi:DNA invertase Pin-like site-specific DNA recombinase
MKAVIYARAAEENTVTTNNALQKQIATCYEYASKNSYEVEAVYKEVGHAVDEQRKELQGLIKHVADSKGVISIILVESADRISRSLPELVQLNDMIHGLGAEIVCATASGTDTADSRLVKNIIAVMHQYSREIRSEHIKAGIRRKRNLNN